MTGNGFVIRRVLAALAGGSAVVLLLFIAVAELAPSLTPKREPRRTLPLEVVAIPELQASHSLSTAAASTTEVPTAASSTTLPVIDMAAALAPVFSGELALPLPTSLALGAASVGIGSLPEGGGTGFVPAQLLTVLELGMYYPAAARRRAIEGASTIEVIVDASGRATSVVLRSSEPAGVFDAAALDVGRALTFVPARMNGRPVASTKTIDLQWKLPKD